MNKKAISAVVATVMIILITVAAVTIFWVAIMPLITQNLDTTCLDAAQNIEVLSNAQFTCFEKSSGTVKLQIEQKSKDFGFAGVKVVGLVGGNSKTGTITMSFEQGTSAKSVIIGDLVGKDISEVEVIPLVSEGATTGECSDAAMTVSLPACPTL